MSETRRQVSGAIHSGARRAQETVRTPSLAVRDKVESAVHQSSVGAHEALHKFHWRTIVRKSACVQKKLSNVHFINSSAIFLEMTLLILEMQSLTWVQVCFYISIPTLFNMHS